MGNNEQGLLLCWCLLCYAVIIPTNHPSCRTFSYIGMTFAFLNLLTYSVPNARIYTEYPVSTTFLRWQFLELIHGPGCVVVDDEPPAGKVIEKYAGLVEGLQLAGSCYNAFEKMKLLKAKPLTCFSWTYKCLSC